MKAYANATREWDVVFDARGHFAEPHTPVIVPLGTLDVRRYLRDIESFGIPGPASEFEVTEERMPFPTKGPRRRYGAVLFIEKEGFLPLFRTLQLAERFDIAIMSTKGLSVTASRALVDKLCGRGEPDAVPLLVVRDFDKAAFSIVKTLAGDTRRYEFENEVKVIDLGLRLADVEAEGLASEDVTYTGDPRKNLKANGATDAEIQYLCSEKVGGQYVGQRVELNAFSSDAFIRWLEAKLVDHGVQKVIPSAADLTAAFKRSLVVEWLRHQMDDLVVDAEEAVRTIPVSSALRRQVTAALAKGPGDVVGRDDCGAGTGRRQAPRAATGGRAAPHRGGGGGLSDAAVLTA